MIPYRSPGKALLMRRAAVAAAVLAAVALGPAWFAATPAAARGPSTFAPGCVGSSLCNPANAPLLADPILSSVTGAVEATGALQTGALATTPVSGFAIGGGYGAALSAEAIGGTAGLVLAGGGALAWKLRATDPTQLPAGSQSYPLATDGTYWTTGGAYNATTGQVTIPVRPIANQGGVCFGVPVSGVPAVNAGVWGNQGAWGSPFAMTVSGSYPTGAAAATSAVRCFLMTTVSGVLPTSFASAAALFAYVPGSGVVVGMQGGTVGGAGPVSRSVQQTVTCKRADGTTHTITNQTSSSVWSPGTLVEVAGLMCPDGERATGVQAVVKGGATDATVVNGTSPGTVDGLPRGCDLASAHCILDLQRKSGSTGWKSCFAAGVDCTGVFTLPTSVQTDTLRCVYGNGGSVAWVDRPLVDCTIYSRIFSPDPGVGLVPPAEVPVDNGFCSMSWGDVLNGSVMYKAVACALQWAFVPRATVVEGQVSTLQQAWSGSILGQVSGTVFGLFGAVNPTGATTYGCAGPVFDLGFLHPSIGTAGQVHPLWACDGLPKTLHDFAAPVALVFLWVAGLWSCWRVVAGAFGFYG